MDPGGDAKAQLLLFGEPRFFNARGTRVHVPDKGLMLALSMVVTGRVSISRTEASTFLWPDAHDASANLRQLLTRIRRVHADPALFLASEYSIHLSQDIYCDLREVQELLSRLDFSNAIRLLDLFGPGLLVGTSLQDGESSRWLYMQATAMQGIVTAAVSDLLESPEATSNAVTACELAHRLLMVDRAQEAAWRTLMRYHAAAGHRERVRQLFEDCRAVLHRDLNAQPSLPTLSLFQQLVGLMGARASSTTGLTQPSRSVAPNNTAWHSALPRLVVFPPPEAVSRDPFFPVDVSLLDDVVVGLCSLKTVNLVAPHTSWKIGSLHADHSDSLERYGISYALETSLWRLNGESKLTAKLYEARTRSILWGESHTLSASNAGAWYRELATGLILMLADAIESRELARFEYGQNPAAYFWHLVGQRHLRTLELSSVRRAATAFKKGLKVDPEFVPALAGRARTLQREWLLLGRGDGNLLGEAEANARRAVTVDARDARGFRELGLCSLYLRRFEDSLDSYARSEQLSPQHADVIADYADALAHAGDPEAGLRKLQRALELNPLPPEQYWWDLAGIHFQLGQYHNALDAISKMEHPISAYRIAAASWALLGNREKAAIYADQFLEHYPDFRIERWLSIVPNRRNEDTRHFELGMKAAGFN